MEPIEKLSNPERVTVPTHLLSGPGDHYILRVVGDNLLDEHITDGDFVIVRKSDTANDRDLAVCLVDDDATIKRVFNQLDSVRLESINKSTSYVVPRDKVKIQGIVVGLMRKF